MLSYNEQLILALELAIKNHKSQIDKSGKPYILHPLHVMETVESDDAKIVAILHDIIEDTPVTKEFLLDAGFPSHIVEAICTLTKEDDEDYFEYVKKVAQNELAKEVKLADLRHNMDITRLKTLKDRDLERNSKYQRAYHFLVNSK